MLFLVTKNWQLSNSVTNIGHGAFEYCADLTSIEIPNSVTYMGDLVFYGCTSLTAFNIPNSITSIGVGVFNGCTALASIEIPNTVTSILEDAFSNCSSLTSIEVHWDTPISIIPDVFREILLSEITLYVPVGTVDKYKFADVWKEFNIVEQQ